MKKQLFIFTTSLLGIFVKSIAFAEEKMPLDSGDTAWMLTATTLVLLMTIPGVALLYGGMVRKKNVLGTMAQSLAITALVSIGWMIAGYSLAFSEGNFFLGDLSIALFNGIGTETLIGSVPESIYVTFQMTFASLSLALITGATAERMKFSAMCIFSLAWLFLVYAPVCHWVWGGGWLGKLGILDFAGGTVVHINAGIAGIVAAYVIGKRIGYDKEAFIPHNLVLTVTGVSLLWIGWFGFNAGSAVAADGTAGMAMLVTQLATAAGAISWMCAEWIMYKKASLLGIASGAIAGLVAITSASGYVDAKGAFCIGLIAGVVCYFCVRFMRKKSGIDDSLDVFALHGIGGILGAVLTGVFAKESIGGTAGALEGNFAQIFIQLAGVGATVIYCALVTFFILKALDKVIGLRVTEEEERIGLDVSLHAERIE